MSDGVKNQIIGVCRFSYAGDGGFTASKLSQTRLEEMLYDADRMERRFIFFENICLPSLAAQTDPDFTLVALIADTMPYRWRRRLKDLMETYPFLQVCTLEPAGPLNSTRRAFKRGWDRQSDFITGFRIDDDDAVAFDYIERTRHIADTLLAIGWADARNPAVVAFHRGIYWDMNDIDDPFHEFREIEPLGLASAMITPVDSKSNIFRWNHRLLAAQVRCWLDPTPMMFVRTLHTHNDSGRSIPPRAESMSELRARRIFRTRFGLDARSLFAAVRKLRTPAPPPK